MGGSAFSAKLATSAFPRLPPSVYRNLKASLLPRLGQYYLHVTVPTEAPEKVDHGDLDLLVSIPKAPYDSLVPHEIIKKALDAMYVNAMEGNRTSNYAVPIRHGEWHSMGHKEDEERNRAETDDGELYYQVDIRVCLDKAEWDRVFFFHSYGDMGMILGLVARNAGVALGEKGLKLPDPPNPPFDLSQSFDDISRFLGLSLETFRAGFNTKQDLSEWVASSTYFDPTNFRTEGQGFTKVKQDRKMYAEFVQWVQQMKRPENIDHRTSREARHQGIREAALLFFDKKQEYEISFKTRSNRMRLKESFSGSCVRDWAELGEYWKGVKLIMDEIRKRLDGEEGILEFLDTNGEDGLRKLVLQVKEDLGIQTIYMPKGDDDGNPESA